MWIRLCALLICAHLVGCGSGEQEAQPHSDIATSADSLLDVGSLQETLDLPGSPQSDNYRVILPDMVGRLVIDGFEITSAMSLESWATFYRRGDAVAVVGEILGSREDADTLRFAIEQAGLQHIPPQSWLGSNGPDVVAIGFTGQGSEETSGMAVQSLTEILRDLPQAVAASDTMDVNNTLDTDPLGLAFMGRSRLVAGVYKLSIPRRELEFSIDGVSTVAGLGFSNRINWQGSPSSAAVLGQLSMLDSAVDQVSEALKSHGFMVSPPHSPAVGETPDVHLIRFFGSGSVEELVVAIRDALSATAVHDLPDGFQVEVVNRHLDDDAVAFALLDDRRILVAHQRSGELQLLVDGKRRPEPLLTVPNLLWSYEQGFVGVAVDPEFPDSNYVYTFHTRRDSVNRVSRYRIQGDLEDSKSDRLEIDEQSVKVLVDVFDAYEYHNGGTLRFGPDQKLYVSTGDDATLERVQDLTHLKAKILRINRDGTAPDDNPAFPSEPADRLKEIFAIGFRNPFRFAIDAKTNELLISDVGSVYIEEFNLSKGGENFGWPLYEGDHVTYETAQLLPPDPTFPIYQYDRISPMCAAIALITYRQGNSPEGVRFPDQYEGTHFVADFRAGPILNLSQKSDGGWQATPFATGFARPVDGTLAEDGSFYVLEYGRSLKRITYQAAD